MCVCVCAYFPFLQPWPSQVIPGVVFTALKLTLKMFSGVAKDVVQMMFNVMIIVKNVAPQPPVGIECSLCDGWMNSVYSAFETNLVLTKVQAFTLLYLACARSHNTMDCGPQTRFDPPCSDKPGLFGPALEFKFPRGFHTLRAMARFYQP